MPLTGIIALANPFPLTNSLLMQNGRSLQNTFAPKPLPENSFLERRLGLASNPPYC